MKRIFFVAGESSGDIHGSNLITALREHSPDIQCEGLGGPRMEQVGMKLQHDLASRAIMGFTEVIKSFGYISSIFLETRQYLTEHPPDVLVLIDYPGFNIRLAKEAKALGIPVVFYISPQVWAWKKGRIQTLARCVDKMLVILPFEKELYDDADLDCTFVGHPLLDHIALYTPDPAFDDGRMTIGLMPGSREQEIQRIYPIMLAVAQGIREQYPDARFVTPCVDTNRAAQVRELAGDFPVDVVEDHFYDLLHSARYCLVASGTATLETALFDVPMAVLYKVTGLTYWLARWFIQVDAISLVNILAEKHIVPEFIQGDATPASILQEALSIIDDTPERQTMLQELSQIRATLGDGGASQKAAAEIMRVTEGHHE